MLLTYGAVASDQEMQAPNMQALIHTVDCGEVAKVVMLGSYGAAHLCGAAFHL